MLGIAFLNEILSQPEILTPAEILEQLRQKFIKELRLQDSSNDGMDISLIRIQYQHKNPSTEAIWAGANNPLWIIRKSDRKVIQEIFPDKQPIGSSEQVLPFTDHRFLLEEGDLFYLFSDGYHDQFGGKDGKKLKKSGFKEVILKMHSLPINDQLTQMESFFDSWKGDRDQVDDICVIGMRM